MGKRKRKKPKISPARLKALKRREEYPTYDDGSSSSVRTTSGGTPESNRRRH